MIADGKNYAHAHVLWILQAGMSAYFYQKGVMDDSVFHFVQGFIAETSLRIYPNREAFEQAFLQACVVSASNCCTKDCCLNHSQWSVSLIS